MPAAFAYKSLYDRPSVHYRDETDISGLVAPCDHLITFKPTMAAGAPVGDCDREQVTLAMVSGTPLPSPITERRSSLVWPVTR
jgi:hypothetical protein